jgi:hypothetical protein
MALGQEEALELPLLAEQSGIPKFCQLSALSLPAFDFQVNWLLFICKHCASMLAM